MIFLTGFVLLVLGFLVYAVGLTKEVAPLRVLGEIAFFAGFFSVCASVFILLVRVMP